MNGMILLGVSAIYLLICLAFGLIRGLGKARFRCITIILSALGAFFGTMYVKTSPLLQSEVMPILEQGATGTVKELCDMMNASPTLYEALAGTITSLLAPLLFLVLFIALSIVTWVVFFLVTLILHGAIKKANARSAFRLSRTVILSVVQGLVVLFVFFVPIYTYVTIAPDMLDAVKDAEITDVSSVDSIMDQYVTPELNSPVIKVFSKVGGDKVIAKLTSFKIGEEETSLKNEIGAVTKLGTDVLKLSKTEMSQYGSTEAALIVAIGDSFGDSKLLITISGELIYNATDAWLNDQAFLGVNKPSLSPLVDPLVKTMLNIMHGDARDISKITADFKTLAKIVSVLAEKGVFANLSDMNTLVTNMGSDGTVGELITAIGSNDSMKALIPEITNMGMRAIASTMNIPEDSAAVYEDFMGDIASALTSTKGQTEEERVENLTGLVETAFADAGIAIDKDLISCYTASLLSDLGDLENVTAEDVQDFFLLNALNMAEAQNENDNPSSTVAYTFPLDEAETQFKGQHYGSMTEEELSQTGAAVLAKVTNELAAMTETDPEAIKAKAAQILEENFTPLLGATSKALDNIKSIEMTEKVSNDSISVAKSLKSADEIKTNVITLDQLLVDTTEAAKNINADTIAKEAQAIDKIFENASGLLSGSVSMDNLDQVAGVVGGILDALNTSSSFGEEKTANLFTAVLQSETVRSAAGIDMETATNLAKAATTSEEGKTVDYSQTMSCVTGAVDVVGSLGSADGIASVEDIQKLLQNLNPQIAGMIREYVTVDRLVGFGLPENLAKTVATMLVKIFDVMASDMPEEKYAKESAAFQQILNIALKAKDNTENKTSLFGGETSILGITASDTVAIFLESDSISAALDATINPVGSAKVNDPFGIGDKIPESSTDVADFRAAISAYRTAHPDGGEELNKRIANIFAMFGMTEND